MSSAADRDEIRETIENGSPAGHSSSPLPDDKLGLDNDDADLFGSGSEAEGADSEQCVNHPRRLKSMC